MSTLLFRNVGKTYSNEVEAVHDFTLEVGDHEFIVLVGPSGCGKSTVLNLIAGLEEVTEGEIWIGDEMVNDLEPKDRNVAMVFQSYALYPYMTVYDNMAFGLKMRKVKKAEIEARVNRVADMLGLQDVLKRRPRNLSGGQRQRVAIGKALVADPRVFLMDEPLSNLDVKMRNSLRQEIMNLYRSVDATFVYVTHDQTEAMTLGTRVVVMNKGRIQQVATPQDIHNKPVNMFVAGFIGNPQMNFIPCTVVEKSGRIYLNAAGHMLSLPGGKQEKIAAAGYAGKEVILGIRPENIHDSTEMQQKYPENCITSTVSNYEMNGSEVHLYFDIAGADVCCKTNAFTAARLDSEVPFTLHPDFIHVFDPETGLTITN